MAKLSAKKRVRIWGVSSPFMDQIHKVIFDRLPYSKYLSELGQNQGLDWIDGPEYSLRVFSS